MRISELSDAAGVTIPTIKYYIREGLLAPGDKTARTQAEYTESHVRRLELIRALREGAGVSIATLGRVFEAMAEHRAESRPAYLKIAVDALAEPATAPIEHHDDYTDATALTRQLLDELGWDTDPDSSGAEQLARALVYVRRHLPDYVTQPSDLIPHAAAVRQLADHEIPDSYDPTDDPDEALRRAVLGTALFEPVLLALRKLAHTDRVRDLMRNPPSEAN